MRRPGVREQMEEAILQANRLVEALPDGTRKIGCQKVLSEIDQLVKQERGRTAFEKTQRLLNYLGHLKQEGLDQPDPLYEEAMREIERAWEILNALPGYLKSQYREDEENLRRLEELAKRNPQAALRACARVIEVLAGAEVPR